MAAFSIDLITYSLSKSERRKKYKEFVRRMIKGKDAMKGEMKRRVLYGSDNFIDQVTTQY
jgi:hypothetical protein